MNTLDSQYCHLIDRILNTGRIKKDRTGTGAISIFGNDMVFNVENEFPMLTIKETHFKSVLHEFLWILGSIPKSYYENNIAQNNIKYLEDNNTRIWREWPYKNYIKWINDNPNNKWNNNGTPYSLVEFGKMIKESVEFSKLFGNVGPIYGVQLRNWNNSIDQLENVINQLKTDPDSRRILVDLWQPASIKEQALPPCHYTYQFYTIQMTLEERIKLCLNNPEYKEMFLKAFPNWKLSIYDTNFRISCENLFNSYNVPKRYISLKFIMRSVDVILGLPFDIAHYGLMLYTVAQIVNMQPYELLVSTGDTHIYLNHIEAAKEILMRTPKEKLPTLKINHNIKNINDFREEDYKLIGYEYNPAIKLKVAV